MLRGIDHTERDVEMKKEQEHLLEEHRYLFIF